ncbi:TPR repeat-containing protein [Gottschalkia purinilytica]|uniref:TPR repeat-containing protein n=1 Tax=Gottschalkia purinilytica TaxID=1503 RepID=A0A0L0W7U2_GOTPU|nr:tetratricopeptide repeat protein [Gottschalkia purinilytica]KNF07506.1 TPR repeat-containing protein [Gottschalkia purinilytica]
MKRLDEYFKKKTKNLSFIEIKPNSYVDIKGYKVGPETPLPLVLDELVKEIQEGKAQDEVNFATVINGIIYTIGVDPKFKHLEEYKKILYNYDFRIEEFILYNGLKKVNEGHLEDGLVWLRALYIINKRNLMGSYNYALALGERAKEAYTLKDNNLGDVFLTTSTSIMEEILDMDPNFSLAYYKLGYHYKTYKQYKKSQLIWQKYLRLGDDEALLQDVRDSLEEIEDDVIYEEGYNEILNGRPDIGLEKLLPLSERYNNWWNLHFMIGLGYRQLGEFQNAKLHFQKVIEVNPKQADAFNELGLCLAYMGNFEDAIESFSKGIDLKPNDYEIICNRGMAYIQVNDIENAKKDINKAYNINPNDEITIACKNELEKYM